MSISFNTIAANIRTPGTFVEFDNSRAVQGLPGQPHRVLLIGTQLAGGSAEPGDIKPVLNSAQAEELFGRGSQLAAMVAAFRRNNRHTELHCLGIEEPDGVAASATVKLTGTATKGGVYPLYIAGHYIAVPVQAGETGAEVTEALAAAVNARTELPVVAAFDAGVATLTCRWKGTSGNELSLLPEYYPEDLLPAGLLYDESTSDFAAGAGVADVSGALAGIGDAQFNTIVLGFTDSLSLSALEELLAERWEGMVQLEGQAFVGKAGSHGELTTAGGLRNSPFLTLVGAGQSPTAPWEWAAAFAGVDTAEPDPARPRQTLPVRGVLPPLEGDRFTREERDLLLHSGVSTYTVDSGGVVLVERIITTYQTNAQGLPDVSYLDITTMRTLAYLRFSYRARMSSRFPRHKLADDGAMFGPGQAVVTPSIARAETVALFQQWEQAGLVENLAQFQDDLLVVRSSSDPNRLEVQMSPDLMNQFRVLAGQIAFLL